MVLPRLSESTVLSVSGWGQSGLRLAISPQKHRALGRFETSESAFGLLGLDLGLAFFQSSLKAVFPLHLDLGC